jgi:hypothetical protein
MLRDKHANELIEFPDILVNIPLFTDVLQIKREFLPKSVLESCDHPVSSNIVEWALLKRKGIESE